MAREDDFRHGGHADDVRAEQLERTDLGGRLEARAGCGKVAASDRFGPSYRARPSQPVGQAAASQAAKARHGARARACMRSCGWSGKGV